MRVFTVRSINTLMSIVLSGILFLAVAGLVLYVSRSSYDNTVHMATDNMAETNRNLVSNVNDLIDSNLGIVQVLALESDVTDFLSGKGEPIDDYLKRQFKVRKGLNSLLVFNAKGVVAAGFTSKGESNAGLNLADRAYVKAALAGKDHVQDEIVLSKSTNSYIFAVATPVRGQDGKILGGVAVTIDWGSFLAEHVAKVKVGSSGYAYILDAKGKLIGHPQKDLILKDMTELPFVRESLAKKKGFNHYVFQGIEKVQVYDQVERTGWITCVTANEAELAALATQQRNSLIVAGAAVYIILLAVILLLVRRQVIAPLGRVMNYSSEVAHGNFKAELTGSFRFEMKDLAGDIRHMTGELKTKIGFAEGVLGGIGAPLLVSDTAGRLAFINRQFIKLVEKQGAPQEYYGMDVAEFFYGDASKDAITTRCMREKQAYENIEAEFTTHNGKRLHLRVDASPIYDLDGVLIGAITTLADLTDLRNQQREIEAQRDRIATAAQAADTISDRLSTAAEELSAQIEEASRGTENQRERLTETTAAVEQMNSSVLDVARNSGSAAQNAGEAKDKAQTGERIVDRAIAASRKVEQSTQAMRGQVEDLSQRASSIGQIMQIIEDIADQTNLLALNAAIEAARAGDAGRGFAVVADEVRKLAEKTMGATKDVGGSIKDIQGSIAQALRHAGEAGGLVVEAVSLSTESGEALREIVSISERSAGQVQSIAAAAEEQSAASEQIARSAEEVSVIASETADAMSQSAQAVSDLARMAGELKELIRDMQV